MEFPLRIEAGDEFDIRLGDEPLRFRANYPHVFPTEVALEDHARQAWIGRYEGLTLIEGKPFLQWDSETYRMRQDIRGPLKRFPAKMDIEFDAVDIVDAFVQLSMYFEESIDSDEPYMEHTGTIEVKPK
jgi:hypothetical protein